MVDLCSNLLLFVVRIYCGFGLELKAARGYNLGWQCVRIYCVLLEFRVAVG